MGCKERICAAAGSEKADLVLKNARFVNVFTEELEQGDIAITDGYIVGIGSYCGKTERDLAGKTVCPGFIDPHIHLESSLVSPRELVRAVLPHGTTTIVTDPHEIANVMGTDGIDFMMQATEGLPTDVFFMLPSCVPATPKDESGAVLRAEDLERYYDNPRVLGLAEMMNAFGVTHCDPTVLEKLKRVMAHGKLCNGHAPGLSGRELNAYLTAGIRSDHECAVLSEAEEKLRRGQYIMIREGTAARNLQELSPLLKEKYADRCLFCTDDKHPNDLLEKGHIDYILREAVGKYGVAPITAIKAATLHAAQYLRLFDRGAIAPGYRADLAVIDGFDGFCVEAVYKNGVMVDGSSIPAPRIDPALSDCARHTFRVKTLSAEDFASDRPLGVIGVIPGQIVTTNEGFAEAADPGKDVLKLALIERHKGTGHIGLGYLKGYGLSSGAVATSVSHDSHNIIVVGTNDADMALAANRVIEDGGGIVLADGGKIAAEVPLEIAGLMSDCPLSEMNEKLEAAKAAAWARGVRRDVAPFMTLSFMALSVIPTLRITTRGVLNAVTQEYL